ncbi:glycoside hydrolase family 3 protein [Trichoderma ceciliae]
MSLRLHIPRTAYNHYHSPLKAMNMRRAFIALLSVASQLVHEAYAECRPPFTGAELTYLGCFSDNETRTLPGNQASPAIDSNTPQACGNLCGSHGYRYAGVESGNQCFCGHAILPPGGSPIPESSCNYGCEGNSTLMCGGYWTINIYEVDNPFNSSIIPLGLPDCTTDPLCSNPICNTSLSVKQRVDGLISGMTLAEKASNLLNSAPGVARLGLPGYEWWSEALHGVAGSPAVHFSTPNGSDFSYATSFPMPILMGAAFDDDLIYQVATTVGIEARAFANNALAGYDFWTPNINPFRDPRWGRGLEVPGEDPFHLQQYVYSLVTGLQGGLDPEVKTIVATCKHFAAYDVEENREEVDIDPSPQDFSEYYLPPMRTCASDAKAGAFMCSYNSEFGMPSCADRYLLQNVLREQWGWSAPENWITSDCGAVDYVIDRHHYVDSDAAAAAVSINAGTDLECGGSMFTHLPDAVAQNITTEATVDQSLSRLYSSLVKVGYFNPPSHLASLGWSDVSTAESQHLAYLAAAEGMVLLKNQGVLPLGKSVNSKKIAVIGPWSNATVQMQGNYYGNAPYLISPLMAFQAAWPGVVYEKGTEIQSNSTDGFSDALDAAHNADYIFFCGGIDTSIESEGMDRPSVDWPQNQLQLISQLAELKKPLIVVQFGGGQLDDSSLLENSGVDAIVWAGYPGQAGGNALKDILTGDYAIAGRLPVTQYPSEYVNKVNKYDPSLRPVKSTGNPGRTYMWYPDAVLPFGYGLSYTKFSFSVRSSTMRSMSIKSLMNSGKGPVTGRTTFATVKVNVENIGHIKSDYVGLLFLSTKNAGPKPHPIKKLASYARLKSLAAGSKGVLTLPLSLESVARSDENGQLYIYPGDYELALDIDSVISVKFTLTGQKMLLQSMPLIPTKSSAISYIGCHDASTMSTALVIELGNKNAPQACSDKCAGSGYGVAGTQGS